MVRMIFYLSPRFKFLGRFLLILCSLIFNGRSTSRGSRLTTWYFMLGRAKKNFLVSLILCWVPTVGYLGKYFLAGTASDFLVTIIFKILDVPFNLGSAQLKY